MSATFSFPKNESDYTQVNIYKSDTLDGTYNLVDTVDVSRMEYEGESGKYYKVSFTDGQNESSQITVKTFEQNVLDILRIEFKITTDELSDDDIRFMIDSVKHDIVTDLSTTQFGEQIEKISDGVYKLPNRFYFDSNFGGVVSPLDVTVYKQEIPITVNSTKTEVDVLEIDAIEQYVKINPVSTNEIIKLDYQRAGRKMKPHLINKTVALKILHTHYDTLYSKVMDGDHEKVKIGDVSISKPAVKKANILQDMSSKTKLRYRQYVQQLTRGFVKVK